MAILFASACFIALQFFVKHKKILLYSSFILILITSVDLLRFGWKFTPFVSQEYLFPETRTIRFLKEQSASYPWRFVGVDYLKNQKRIFPPNIASYYGLYTLDTYNPLLVKHFQNYAAVSEFGTPDLDTISFNRMIELNNFESRLLSLAGVKYIAALSDLPSKQFRLLFREGETRLYENTYVTPRAFMLYDYTVATSEKKTAELLNKKEIDLAKTAIVGKKLTFPPTQKIVQSNVTLTSYEANRISATVVTAEEGLLMLTDTYYPTWKVLIDGKKAELLRVNMTFRGVVIPKGTHEVVFYTSLL